jgi:outer membrane receptor for monomeric catechols
MPEQASGQISNGAVLLEFATANYLGKNMSNLDRASCRFTPSLAWAGILTAGWSCGVHAQTVATVNDGTLHEVVVTGQRQHYRGDVPVEELPQAVQVISSELLQEVGAVRLNDALDIAAGVARQNTFGGVWDSFAIRGFAGDINVPSGYLVNGFNSGRGFGGLRDTSSVERIEVLKGPGSALFGQRELPTRRGRLHLAHRRYVRVPRQRCRRAR